jgi:ankyrin repeat protein
MQAKSALVALLVGALSLWVCSAWAQNGDLQKVEVLLKDNPALVFSRDNDPAGVGDLQKVKVLLKDNPALVFSRDSAGDTALWWAAMAGYKDAAELLLANGADVNAKDSNGQTPLHIAAYRGHKDVARVLLANKADVNARQKDGRTPLHMAAAARSGHPEDVADLLLANRADVNAKNNDGSTPLHMAASNDRSGEKYSEHRGVEVWQPGVDVARVLLANRADVNAKNNDGSTPLHVAASLCPCRGDPVFFTSGDGRIEGVGAQGNARSRGANVAELLLADKADVNARDNNGRTALYWAAKTGHTDIVTLLRQHHGKK